MLQNIDHKGLQNYPDTNSNWSRTMATNSVHFQDSTSQWLICKCWNRKWNDCPENFGSNMQTSLLSNNEHFKEP